jgi:hypothetical protein
VGYIALVFALGIGTAYALDRNSVKSKHIAKSQVKPSDINKSAEAAWIFVHDNQRANSSPGVQVTRLNAGNYRVRFPFSVRRRALLATATDYQTNQTIISAFRCGGASGDLNCPSPHPNDARTVFVGTFDDFSGMAQDSSFWLAAIP